MAAATGGAALGGLNPHRNPSGDGGPRLQSPPGKGNKPAALADITNTGRPNAPRSVSVADVVKENAKLIHLLTEKTKIIDISRVELQKLRLALQASRQQNLLLAQTNSQITAELNVGKDRLKTLQHELQCATALLKVKDSELERKNKTANQRRKEIKSQVMKAIPSNAAVVDAQRIDSSFTSAVEHQSVESESGMPSNNGTDCQEVPQVATKRRGQNKRKSVSNEHIEDTSIVKDHYKSHLPPIMSLDHEDPRKLQRRRSSRLNHVTEVSNKTLHEDTVVSSALSTSNIQKQHGPTTGIDMGKSLQDDCSYTVHVTRSSEFEKIEINEQSQMEANMKEIQEAHSRVLGTEARQIGDRASNAKQCSLTEMQSSSQFNTSELPKPPEDTVTKRGANKKTELCEIRKESDIEGQNIKCDISNSEARCHQEKRKSQRRKSARLNSVTSDDTKNTFETLHEDVIAPLPSSSSNALHQRTNMKQVDGHLVRSTEGQVGGRRSLRQAAEKVVSYKEIPLNVKMRRP